MVPEKMVQFIECLVFPHVLVLHLYDPMASSEPALSSPGSMERRIWHFLDLAPGHSPIQPDKQPCHMPFAQQGKASITHGPPALLFTGSTSTEHGIRETTRK